MIRLLPGQVVVREEPRPAGRLWTPDPNPRQVRTHTGRVLALGPPALYHGHPVPHGFQVGDLVQYHFTHHQEAWSHPWPPDGLPATWVPQQNVDAVWEETSDEMDHDDACEECFGTGLDWRT